MEDCVAHMESEAKVNRKFLGYIAIVALLIVVTGQALYASPHKPTSGSLTLKDVERALRNAGLQVRRGAHIRQPYLHTSGTLLIVNGENGAEVQAYVYSSSAAREQDTNKLDPKTAAPPTVSPTWIAPPSLVLTKNVALIVLTRDEELRNKIAKAFVGE